MSYALITGASSGIGRHYASELASRGHNIIAVSNQPTLLAETAEELASKYGVEVHTIDIDLMQPTAAKELFERCQRENWQVDYLICNAGILLFSTLVNTKPESLTGIISLHCTTTTLLCRYFGEAMKERRQGRILIMSSSTAWLPYKNMASALWYELRPYGVSVTTVYPGAVDTPLYKLNDKLRRLFVGIGIMSRSESVARRGVRAMLRGQRRLVPGFFTKVVIGICAIIPARLLYPILRIGPIRRLLERV